MGQKIKQILNHFNHRNVPILPKFSKLSKIILSIVVVISLTFTITSVLATTQTENVEAFKKKQAAIEKGNNQESWMYEAFLSNMMTLVKTVGGNFSDSVLKGQSAYVPDGLLGASHKAIAALYNPPASGIEYIAQVKDNFLGKPAYAQGIGFKGLQPLLPIWKSFRNVTYSIFAIIFVGMGIAIMLRIKISPQAVISIQNSIPKIISSLILITFSYAIAGLLIDLSYLVLALVLSTINVNNTINVSTEVNSPNLMGLVISLIPGQAYSLISGFPAAIATLLGADATLTTILTVLSAIGNIGGFILGLLVILIFTLIFTIKLFFGLAKCYVNLILKIIIGPLEIALGAIPNMKMGFNTWIMDVIANLSVFPIVIIFISLLKVINSQIQSGLWAPPGFGVLGNIIPTLIGLTGFMLVAKLPAMIPEFIFQIKPSPWGKAIGESFSESWKGVGAVGKSAPGQYVKQKAGDKVGEGLVSIGNRMEARGGFARKFGSAVSSYGEKMQDHTSLGDIADVLKKKK